MKMKCKICGEIKSADEFERYITLSGRQKRRYQCRKCRIKAITKRNREKGKTFCPVCQKIKQPFDFTRSNSLDFRSYGKICRECAYQKNLDFRKANQKKFFKKIDTESGLIHCFACGKYKSSEHFYKNSLRPDGYDSNCKECRRKQQRKCYYETKRFLISFFNNKCAICGKSFEWYAYDFHHKNSKEKELKISLYTKLTVNMLKQHKEFLNELKKCILVCAICHRKIHTIEEKRDEL